MSLRVLLADESDTIKKVFQLALQDLNAEIKSVHSGLDVIDVAQTFQPSIIFADVLLQKKNGYETCREIKQNPNLARIPVVLMWSSFMELDQEQFKKSKADDQLEKPFDADYLREQIKKHVPQTQENPLGAFLNFPKSITAGMKAEVTKAGAVAPAALPETPQEDTSEFNIASFLDGEFAKDAEPEAASAAPPATPEAPAGENWQSTDLSKFKLDLEAPADNLEKFEALNLREHSVAAATPPAEVREVTAAPPAVIYAPPPPTTAARAPAEKTNPGVKPPPSFDLNLGDDEENTNVTNHDADVPAYAQSGMAYEPSAFITNVDDRAGTETKTRTRMPVTGTFPPEGSGKKIATVGLNDDEIEAIIRAHTEEVIKTQVVDSLTVIIERIVRDELSKLLDDEVRLKQEINSDNL